MPQALIKFAKVVIAEGAVYEKDNDDIYFPILSVQMEFLRPGETREPTKLGEKRFYDVVVGEKVLEGRAWCFEEDLAPKAEKFRGMIGFLNEHPLMLVQKRLPLTYVPAQPARQIETIDEGEEED
ncbi:hypothetical protein EX30DRAFT_216355 [Ascodesmis nigricans]|uniref:DUF427 domain-containing protein n=1 Tax=Ascodesmis nigricans TaxID=341454 RepID=A0A4S2MZB6_9PEZI|nr:hypothetical protein EX30DRAFT_216355 [Ascodesmis nigricans]